MDGQYLAGTNSDNSPGVTIILPVGNFKTSLTEMIFEGVSHYRVSDVTPLRAA